MPLIIKLAFISLLILSAVVFVFVWIRNRRRRILELLQLKLFLLKFPRSSKEGKELMQEIALNERIFSAVAAFKKPIVFEVAVPNVGEEISFYVATPPEISHAFIKQIQSIWNDVHAEEVDDYNIFNYAGSSLGATLGLKKHYSLPIKTYREFNSDPFQSILGGFSKINAIGEGAAFQVIVKPAQHLAVKSVKSVIEAIKEGKNPIESKSVFSEVMEAVKGKPEKEEKKDVDQVLLEAIESKISKPLVEVNARIIVSAPSSFQADELFRGLTTAFSQFSTPKRNEFKLIKPRKIRELAHKYSFREFDESMKMVLNTEELASIFHFPTPFTETPKVKFLKARQLPPPADLPKEGLLLGVSVFRGEERQVYITDDDRRRHIYLIGQTGTGKSNLLINMVLNDILKGKGVGIIDPHGDMINHLLGLIPDDRVDDVILFDPSLLEKPLGLNMIEYNLDRPEEKTFIVNELINIFDKLYDLKVTGGPLFEQYMRNALLLLMEDAKNEQLTLMEIPRVFTDSDFRERKLKRIQNPAVETFWAKEAVRAGGDWALSNITPYITSKFNTFIANEYMRVIIGQRKSSINFRQIMDEGRILLVNLSKGKIGELNANLLGMIIVGKILAAAFSRVDVPEEKRKDFNLFIDEFQNFTTDSIAIILSEARKYRLNLSVAHQFIAQLREEIRDAVFGNVGSIISFRVGIQDAEFLVKQFEPHLTVDDLTSIDNFNSYVRLLIRGSTTKPFNIRTYLAPAPDLSRALYVESVSAKKHGRPREEIEEDIRKRLTE